MMDTIVIPGLVGGRMTALVFCLLIAASYLKAPEVWIADMTRGEREVPDKAQAALWGLSVMAVLFCGSLATALWSSGTGGSFWRATAAAYLVHVVINFVDLALIDIIVYQWIQPDAIKIPGIEPLQGTWPHVQDALKGLVIGAAKALAAGGATLL